MFFRLSLCLALSLVASPATFRATTTVFIAEEADFDEDGLDDEMEALLGTNPEDPDTDADGWDDLTEILRGTDPCDPNDHPGQLIATTGLAASVDTTASQKRPALLIAQRGAVGTTDRPTTPTGPVHDFSLRYYYLGGRLPNLAVEVRRNDLKAGSFLLLWRQHVKWNPLEIEQRYTVAIRTDDGRTIAQWQTPVPAETAWRYVGLPFSLKPSDEGRVLTLSLIPTEEGQLEYSLSDFAAVPAGIEADVDRDGVIDAEERPAAGKPLRHWVNDDDDQGECQERSDVPGRPAGQADHAQEGIDGLRDLVDFLPLNLNLSRVARLLKPADGFRYYVTHPDSAVQIALTGLTPAKAGLIHREADLMAFGPSLGAGLAAAEILKPDAEGRIELSAHYVERIAELGHGVILAEGTKVSRQPLQLEIRQDGHTVATIPLPMAIGSVESMYRHVNLAACSTDYAGERATIRKIGRPRQVADPEGLPDAETNERWVVLIHGYNVPGDGARGWHAETFKRLRVLGSNARFVGVTWNGDTGLDYHRAVYHAFQVGDELPRALGFLDASRTLLIGHSLGNIVASQAVQAGFAPACYCMLNAALPIEAINAGGQSPGQAAEMTEQLWRPYQRRLFAAEWAKLQPIGDQRRTYTWNDAFARVRDLDLALNCFSPGEDVTNCPPETTSASVLATLWSGRAVDYGVWKTQELLKGVGWGRSLGALAMQRSQGGWGFNPAWRGRYVSHGQAKGAGGHFERLTPMEAARLTNQQIGPDPFFNPMKARWLHQARPARPSPLIDSPHVRYELLATAIPAMSFAAGAAEIPRGAGTARVLNFNLEAEGRSAGRWPVEGHAGKHAPGRWLHSDYKNVALPFVHPLFSKMIAEGSLR